MTIKSAVVVPDLSLERTWAAQHRSNGTSNTLIAGFDEVGRGALAGNVTVGCVIVDPITASELAGVRDSKLLSQKHREELVEPIKSWARGWGVGHATAIEIDDYGITVALRLAGHRALRQATAEKLMPARILLDGSHDWLSPVIDLFSAGYDHEYVENCPPVSTVLKGDLKCLSVAAASILAKVERDHLLSCLDEQFPEYGWKQNKGYGSGAHRAAIQTLGPTIHHRHSWLSKILSTHEEE
ncbi:ribonuclease HII [Micrococcoides hystricis]|uniref:Ribonuclease HII n=1 Tax=Micrococcoides hystricis TaxID=1572761 RepID=A0ABV6PC55_9MICC